MTMTAAPWNSVPFGSGLPYSASNNGAASCRCSYCMVPQSCNCSECIRFGYHRYNNHSIVPADSTTGSTHHQQQHNSSSADHHTPSTTSSSSLAFPPLSFYSASMNTWATPPVPMQLPILPSSTTPVGNNSSTTGQTAEQCSSDEALSPPHQDDPYEDMMDVKEASRLQQEIVKAWKQKKRSSCEMKTRTHDKYRQVYSAQQRFELEKEFHYQRYISSARKSELSRVLQLSERQIKIWFQNRRAKERRSKKNALKQNSPDGGDVDSPKMSQFVKIKESPASSPLPDDS